LKWLWGSLKRPALLAAWIQRGEISPPHEPQGLLESLYLLVGIREMGTIGPGQVGEHPFQAEIGKILQHRP